MFHIINLEMDKKLHGEYQQERFHNFLTKQLGLKKINLIFKLVNITKF